MRELPIRKIPGIGRVSERLLDSIGVKVRRLFPYRMSCFIHSTYSTRSPDMRRHLQVSRCAIVTG